MLPKQCCLFFSLLLGHWLGQQENVGGCCRDDWAAELRNTKTRLLQAEQLARGKESETEDLRKAYEVTALLAVPCSAKVYDTCTFLSLSLSYGIWPFWPGHGIDVLCFTLPA